jgi:hypothetical protein
VPLSPNDMGVSRDAPVLVHTIETLQKPTWSYKLYAFQIIQRTDGDNLMRFHLPHPKREHMIKVTKKAHLLTHASYLGLVFLESHGTYGLAALACLFVTGMAVLLHIELE